MHGQKHRKNMKRFVVDEKGFAAYSAIGIMLIVLSSGIFLYMMSMDSRSAKTVIAETAQTKDVSAILQVKSDLNQVLRKSAEEVLLQDSIATFCEDSCTDKGISISGTTLIGPDNVNIFTPTGYKRNLEKKIKDKVFSFYHNGSISELDKEYNTISTIYYDFSNFIKDYNDFKITLIEEDSDMGHVKVKIVFVPEKGIIRRTNRESGSTFITKGDTEVEVNARPFILHKLARNFTTDDLGASDIKWTIWGIQEIVALVEANTKHDVSIATDPRIIYTLTHLLIAKKEAKRFGTIDYIHVPYEALRPWIGSADSNKMNDLFATLTKAQQDDYAGKLAKIKEDAEKAEQMHTTLVSPAASELWKARQRIGSKPDKEKLRTRISDSMTCELEKKQAAEVVNNFPELGTFDIPASIGSIWTEVQGDFRSDTNPQANIYLDNISMFSSNIEDIEDVLDSRIADLETKKTQNKWNEAKGIDVEVIGTSLIDKYNSKIENFDNSEKVLNLTADSIKSSWNALKSFDKDLKCCNFLLAQKFFIDGFDPANPCAPIVGGGVLTDELNLKKILGIKIIDLKEIEDQTRISNNRLEMLESEFRSSVKMDIDNIKSDIDDAKEILAGINPGDSNGSKENVNLAIEKLEKAKNRMEGLKSRMNVNFTSEIGLINRTLNANALKIFDGDEVEFEEDIFDVLTEVYLATYSASKAGEDLKDASINADELRDGLGFLLEIMGPLIDQMNQFSKIANMIEGGDIGKFPNKNDQLLSVVPMPPWNPGGMFGEDKKLSVVHNLWYEVGAGAFSYKIPIIGKKISLPPGGTGPSFPIPFTPVHISGYQYKISPLVLKNPITNEPIPIESHLRIIDYRNALIGQVLNFNFQDENIPVPLKYHRYPMYHYHFKPKELNIEVAGVDVPVVVFALGPFTEKLGRNYEPMSTMPEQQDVVKVKLQNITSLSANIPQYKYNINFTPKSSLAYYSYKLSNAKGEVPSTDPLGEMLVETRTKVQSLPILVEPDNYNPFMGYGYDVITLTANTPTGLFDYDSLVFMQQDFKTSMKDGTAIEISPPVGLAGVAGGITIQNMMRYKQDISLKVGPTEYETIANKVADVLKDDLGWPYLSSGPDRFFNVPFFPNYGLVEHSLCQPDNEVVDSEFVSLMTEKSIGNNEKGGFGEGWADFFEQVFWIYYRNNIPTSEEFDELENLAFWDGTCTSGDLKEGGLKEEGVNAAILRDLWGERNGIGDANDGNDMNRLTPVSFKTMVDVLALEHPLTLDEFLRSLNPRLSDTQKTQVQDIKNYNLAGGGGLSAGSPTGAALPSPDTINYGGRFHGVVKVNYLNKWLNISGIKVKLNYNDGSGANKEISTYTDNWGRFVFEEDVKGTPTKIKIITQNDDSKISVTYGDKENGKYIEGGPLDSRKPYELEFDGSIIQGGGTPTIEISDSNPDEISSNAVRIFHNIILAHKMVEDLSGRKMKGVDIYYPGATIGQKTAITMSIDTAAAYDGINEIFIPESTAYPPETAIHEYGHHVMDILGRYNEIEDASEYKEGLLNILPEDSCFYLIDTDSFPPKIMPNPADITLGPLETRTLTYFSTPQHIAFEVKAEIMLPPKVKEELKKQKIGKFEYSSKCFGLSCWP